MAARKRKKKLTPRQELFCDLYATTRDHFGNGVSAYAEAYNIDLERPGKYATARSNAYRLLINADILARIKELLELGPLNDEVVDRELAFVISQNAELPAKVSAIKEYNALKGRILKKIDLTSDGKPLQPIIMDSSIAEKYADAASGAADDSAE